MHRLFNAGVKLTTLLLAIAIIGGWFQSVHPALDSLSHFRLHLAGLLLVCIVLLTLLRATEWGVGSVMVVFVSTMLTWPYLPGTVALTQSNAAQGTVLRIVQMNLRFNNSTPRAAVAAIRTGDPHIVLLQEVTRKTESVMTDLKGDFPYQLSCQIRGVGSVAILSSFTFVDVGKNKCARFFGFASAVVSVNGRPLTLASFHSKWPWPAKQSRQIDDLEADFRALRAPLILAGDFNSAPWSAVVQRVARMTGTFVAEGLILTWAPRFLEFKTTIGALLPLDQILLSPQLTIIGRQKLQDGGSDHFPILTTARFED